MRCVSSMRGRSEGVRLDESNAWEVMIIAWEGRFCLGTNVFGIHVLTYAPIQFLGSVILTCVRSPRCIPRSLPVCKAHYCPSAFFTVPMTPLAQEK